MSCQNADCAAPGAAMNRQGRQEIQHPDLGGARSDREPVCPSDPFDCHCWPPCYSAAGSAARRARREQHARRAARFGEQVVTHWENLVAGMAVTDAGLSRENVLSLMEGAYSSGLGERTGTAGEERTRAALRLVNELIDNPGNRAGVLQAAARIQRDLAVR